MDNEVAETAVVDQDVLLLGVVALWGGGASGSTSVVPGG
jgi:hypothetical protein